MPIMGRLADHETLRRFSPSGHLGGANSDFDERDDGLPFPPSRQGINRWRTVNQ